MFFFSVQSIRNGLKSHGEVDFHLKTLETSGDIDLTVESVRRRSWATIRTQSSSVNFYSWNISPWEFLFFSSWTSIFPPLQMRLIILGLCLAALWDVFPVGHASERKPTEHFWIFMPCLTHFNGRRMLSSSGHRAETSLKCPVASVSSRHHVQIMSEGDDGLRNVGQEFRALGWKTRLWNCDAKAVGRHHEVTINLTLPCHRYVTATCFQQLPPPPGRVQRPLHRKPLEGFVLHGGRKTRP